MNIEETVDFHLRSTLFAMRRMYNALAVESGLTQGIGYALINIGKEGIPATKIAPMMGMTSSSLSRMLKNMEVDGIIYRKPDKKDKRIVKIFVTEKGLVLREKVKVAVIGFNKKLLAQVSSDEIKAFEKVNLLIREQVKVELEEFQDK